MSDLIKSSFGCDPENTVCSAETEDIVKSKGEQLWENILEQMSQGDWSSDVCSSDLSKC